jgi:hypothetical protein
MVGDVDALGDTNLSMVLAAMVEDLFSDQNLIDCHPPRKVSGTLNSWRTRPPAKSELNVQILSQPPFCQRSSSVSQSNIRGSPYM